MSNSLLALAMAVSLAAGVVRGFAGFGHSALTVAGLAVLVSALGVARAAADGLRRRDMLSATGCQRSDRARVRTTSAARH